ncbi:MAG TPA: ribonuclease HII [Bacteroidia bacterium]|jgi:ribonuclease HII|nr:ribonuclease HII [Bacteroidia bacterium]
MLKPYHKKGQIEAGCDEAGRGCLAGPVVAAAVIFPEGYKNSRINDSKQITEKLRFEIADTIKKEALTWAVGVVSHTEIDEINILNASFLAMHRAVDQLKQTPGLLLIDGNRFNRYKNVKHLCVIKGDGIYMSIAAASLLAKTHRDTLMLNLHKEYAHYGWDTNKGYPTKAHRAAIAQHGSCTYHRKSFTLLPPQLSLFSGAEI